MPGATKAPLSARPSHTTACNPAGSGEVVIVRRTDPELRFRNSAFNDTVHAAFAVATVTLNCCPASGDGDDAGLKRIGAMVSADRLPGRAAPSRTDIWEADALL